MEEIFWILEDGIVRLVDIFLAKPYLFYTESDLHCYLYHVLWSLSLSRGCRVKVDGRTVESVLLHRQYPTKGRYRRYLDRESEKDRSGDTSTSASGTRH